MLLRVLSVPWYRCDDLPVDVPPDVPPDAPPDTLTTMKGRVTCSDKYPEKALAAVKKAAAKAEPGGEASKINQDKSR